MSIITLPGGRPLLDQLAEGTWNIHQISDEDAETSGNELHTVSDFRSLDLNLVRQKLGDIEPLENERENTAGSKFLE